MGRFGLVLLLTFGLLLLSCAPAVTEEEDVTKEKVTTEEEEVITEEEEEVAEEEEQVVEEKTELAGFTFVEMLRLIPDSPTTRSKVYMNDYARIRETYDIPLPSSDADDEAIGEYITMLSRNLAEGPFISGMWPRVYALTSAIRRENIGFGPQDVDIEILAGEPPMTFEAIGGGFDLAAIEDAISKCDESVMPEIGSYRGIVTYDWGPDSQTRNRLRPPAFDNLGYGKALAVQQDCIFRVSPIDSIQAMIDASLGRLTSLADGPDFNLMATALSEMGVHSVVLTDQVQGMASWKMAMTEELKANGLGDQAMWVVEKWIEEGEPLLSPYRTYAVGHGQDNEGPFVTMVLVYASPQEAASDVAVLKQRIEKGESLWTGRPMQEWVDTLEIWADGRSLRVKLRGAIVRIWSDLVSVESALSGLLLQRE